MKLYKATFADDEEEKKINEVFIVPSQKVFEIEKVVKRLEKKGLKAFIEKLGSVQIPVYPASQRSIQYAVWFSFVSYLLLRFALMKMRL